MEAGSDGCPMSSYPVKRCKRFGCGLRYAIDGMDPVCQSHKHVWRKHVWRKQERHTSIHPALYPA